jgi:hypothetical protein
MPFHLNHWHYQLNFKKPGGNNLIGKNEFSYRTIVCVETMDSDFPVVVFENNLL